MEKHQAQAEGENQVEEGGKKTFARRRRPTQQNAALRWDVVKSSFYTFIFPRVGSCMQRAEAISSKIKSEVFLNWT